MGAPGSLKPARAYDEVITLVSRWEIGATGAHTKDFGKGFSSVARTAAGAYTVTFTDVPEGPLIGLEVQHWSQATVEPLVTSPVDGSYSASAKTVKYETWAIDTTPAQTELPSGDKVTIIATFIKSQ